MEPHQNSALERARKKLEAAKHHHANALAVAPKGCCEISDPQSGASIRSDGVTQIDCRDAASSEHLPFNWHVGHCQ